MASAVPIEVVDWAYQETPPLYACLSCKRVGEAKVIEDHVLAQHHEGPPPFQCAPCKRKLSRELKARSHVTKNHSGKTFKEVIVKKPEVNILASGARPLSEGEAKSHLQDQIAKKMLKFPLKRKAEWDQSEGQPPIAAKSRPETLMKAEASAIPQQKGPEVEPIVLPAAPQADRALPAARPKSPAATQPEVTASVPPAEVLVPLTPNLQDTVVCHAPAGNFLLLTPLSVGCAPLSSMPSPKTNETEELRSLVKALLENQAKDRQLMQELLQGQKDLKTRLDKVDTKRGHYQDKLKAQNRTIGSIHSDVRAVASQVDALKKEVKHSALTAELTTVRSRLDKGLAKMTTRLAEIQKDLGSLKDAPSASTSAPLKTSLARQEAQLKTLRSELAEVKAKVEGEFAAARNESRNSSQQMRRVSHEHRRIV